MSAYASQANDALLNTRETAAALGVHPSRVLQLIRAERLPGAFKKGAIWLIPTDTVQQAAIQQRRAGRPRVVGTRVRTDRINAQMVPPGAQPLTGEERYAVQQAVAEAINLSRNPPTPEQMIEAGEAELLTKDWPTDIRRRVVAMIIFGRLPSEA